MNITVTFRHVNASDGLRAYATQKVERLKRFARHALEAHVILGVEKQRHRAEILVAGRDLHVAAAEETVDLYSALDLAVDKVERQLKKWIEKRKNHKTSRGQPNVPSNEDSGDAEPTPRIATLQVPVKPMSVAEALLQLQKAKTNFLLFHNAATDSVAVLYRGKDGVFNLLQPEPA